MARVNQIALIAAITSHLDKRHQIKHANQRQMNAIIKAATDICLELDKPHRPAVPGMGIVAWMCSDDVGLSSLYMLKILSGGRYGHASNITGAKHWPCDADDFGRCLGLLKAAPELRDNMQLLAETCQQWRNLISLWTQLEHLYEHRGDARNEMQLNGLLQMLCETKEQDDTELS